MGCECRGRCRKEITAYVYDNSKARFTELPSAPPDNGNFTGWIEGRGFPEGTRVLITVDNCHSFSTAYLYDVSFVQYTKVVRV